MFYVLSNASVCTPSVVYLVGNGFGEYKDFSNERNESDALRLPVLMLVLKSTVHNWEMVGKPSQTQNNLPAYYYESLFLKMVALKIRNKSSNNNKHLSKTPQIEEATYYSIHVLVLASSHAFSSVALCYSRHRFIVKHLCIWRLYAIASTCIAYIRIFSP